MNTLLRLMPILTFVSTISVLIAFFFLQSRAKGLARVLIVCGALAAVLPSILVMFITIENRSPFHGIIAAEGTSTGLILLSAGVILFSISLPSRRLEMSPEDRKPISDQIIKETERMRSEESHEQENT